jgi:hypothetical protein
MRVSIPEYSRSGVPSMVQARNGSSTGPFATIDP